MSTKLHLVESCLCETLNGVACMQTHAQQKVNKVYQMRVQCVCVCLCSCIFICSLYKCLWMHKPICMWIAFSVWNCTFLLLLFFCLVIHHRNALLQFTNSDWSSCKWIDALKWKHVYQTFESLQSLQFDATK